MDTYLGTLLAFGFNFAPSYDFVPADGRLISIAQQSALFSLLGATYGGDGRSTFAVPDLRGRVALGYGQSPNTSHYALGQRGGSETNTLNVTQMPVHNHGAQATVNVAVPCTDSAGDQGAPSGHVPAAAPSDRSGNYERTPYGSQAQPGKTLAPFQASGRLSSFGMMTTSS